MRKGFGRIGRWLGAVLCWVGLHDDVGSEAARESALKDALKTIRPVNPLAPGDPAAWDKDRAAVLTGGPYAAPTTGRDPAGCS